MFSKPLYEDKPDKVLTPEELAKQSEEEKKQREIEEEAEYLETLSTFHWIVYPFFKTIETVCDKIFGCKRKLEAQNVERRARVAEKMEAKQKEREEKRQQMMEDQRKAEE